MSDIPDNADYPILTPYYEQPVGKNQSLVVTFPSTKRKTGKTTIFRNLIHSRTFDASLEREKKRILLLEFSPYKDSVLLFPETSARDRNSQVIRMQQELIFLLEANSDSHRSLAPVITRRSKQIDVISLAPSSDDYHDIMVDLLQEAPELIARLRASHFYDAILVDPPDFYYSHYVRRLVNQANYWILPYPVGNPNAMSSIFSLNYPFMSLRVVGAPVRSRVIPIFADADLDAYASTLRKLQRLIGTNSLLPVIPDMRENALQLKRKIGNLSKVGFDELGDRIVELIQHFPTGLQDHRQKMGRILLKSFHHFEGPVVRVSDEGRNWFAGLYPDQRLSVKQLTARVRSDPSWTEEEREMIDEKDIQNLLAEISMVKHWPRIFCERKMGIESSPAGLYVYSQQAKLNP